MQGQGPAVTTEIPTVTPEFDNCKVLHDTLHLSWKVDNDNSQVRFRLCGCTATDPRFSDDTCMIVHNIIIVVTNLGGQIHQLIFQLKPLHFTLKCVASKNPLPEPPYSDCRSSLLTCRSMMGPKPVPKCL